MRRAGRRFTIRKLMKTTPIFLASFLAFTIVAAAQPANLPKAIPLWIAGAPGSEARAGEPEKVDASDGD